MHTHRFSLVATNGVAMMLLSAFAGAPPPNENLENSEKYTLCVVAVQDVQVLVAIKLMTD